MQAASDIFLGWTKGADTTRHFYWRQLKDMKGSIDTELIRPEGLLAYATACGWTLARAHARTGDAIAIAAYLGKSDVFDRAMVEFSERYADQNELDHAAFLEAVKSGRLAGDRGDLSWRLRREAGQDVGRHPRYRRVGATPTRTTSR